MTIKKAKITDAGRAQELLNVINALPGGKTLTQAEKDAIGTGASGATTFLELTDIPDNPSEGQVAVFRSGTFVFETKAATTGAIEWGNITGTLENQLDLSNTLGGKSNVGHTHKINDLSDVAVTTPVNDTLLVYDSIASAWTNQTPAEAGVAAAKHTHTLEEITNVGSAAGRPATDFAAASHGHYLVDILDSGTAAAAAKTDFATAAQGAKADTALQPGSVEIGTAPIRAVTASATITMDDIGGSLLMNVTTANTATIPTNATVAVPIGGFLNVVQIGAGVTTVTAATGVTLNGVSAGSATMANQYDSFALQKIGTDAWIAPNVTVA